MLADIGHKIVSQGVGRPAIGFVSDKFGRINVAGLGTLIASVVAFFLWIFAGKYYAGVIIYALFGLFAGILWPTVAPVGAEVVGIQLLPAGKLKAPFLGEIKPAMLPGGADERLALSIYWLILVLPSTFAEAIGLTLRKNGVDGYIDVQVFTGVMYLAGFISSMLLFCSPPLEFLTWKIPESNKDCTVWTLRSWKLREMELLGLNKEQREAETRDNDVFQTPEMEEQAARVTSDRGETSILVSYVKKYFVVQHV